MPLDTFLGFKIHKMRFGTGKRFPRLHRGDVVRRKKGGEKGKARPPVYLVCQLGLPVYPMGPTIWGPRGTWQQNVEGPRWCPHVVTRSQMGLPRGSHNLGPTWHPATKCCGSHVESPCGSRVMALVGPARFPSMCAGSGSSYNNQFTTECPYLSTF